MISHFLNDRCAGLGILKLLIMARFVPRQKKHKERQGSKPGQSQGDSNAEVILPPSQAEKEERRRKLREELRAQQQQPKISSKKQKRLDKYIVGDIAGISLEPVLICCRKIN